MGDGGPERWRRSRGRPPAATSQDINAPKIRGCANDFMLILERGPGGVFLIQIKVISWRPDGYMQHISGPLHAETMTGLRAAEVSAEFGPHRVVPESDSKVLVQALNSDDYDRATIGVLLHETHSVCHANFEPFSFNFCKRDCNKVSHELAAFGFRARAADLSWIE
ncbi:uncharacterized protein [Triticum aestivum]|uniref:uncharacterized protein n=1 Tax=Triticum aestivum TaxID=4565 RepID=UPI001D022032|nr:uncharacterized protein LOC123112179 [Triticum aestivum]